MLICLLNTTRCLKRYEPLGLISGQGDTGFAFLLLFRTIIKLITVGKLG